jgi:phage terminase small subunit
MGILPNPKHELFAQELAKGITAEEAYTLAGYAPNRGNYIRLKANESIKARVAEILAAACEKAGVTVDRIIEELAKIGFADFRKAVKWGESVLLAYGDGEFLVSHEIALRGSDEIDDATAGAISEVRKTKEGLALKMHDKRAALVDLGKHLGCLLTARSMSVRLTPRSRMFSTR